MNLLPRPPKSIALVAALAVLCTAAFVGPAGASEQRLTADDSGLFGVSAAIDGDTLVVGAPGDATSNGAVFVFRRDGDGWRQIGKLVASDGKPGDALGRSVAIEGDTIVAGAPGRVLRDDDPDGAPGAVYRFSRDGAAVRRETAKLTPSDGAPSDQFGFSVAVDGDTIVAGAPSAEVGKTLDQGAAYTFTRTGEDRTETAKLTADDGEAIAQLGFSVAIDGDTIVAGAPFATGPEGLPLEGSAYTFASTGARERNQTAKLTLSDGLEEEFLGLSVAIDGDTILAGAPGHSVRATSGQGAVLTFSRDGAATRTQTGTLTASDGKAQENLGQSVAIDGETIVAGAPRATIGVNGRQGAVYTFSRTGAASRPETAKLISRDGAALEEFGFSVAIQDDTLIGGAPSAEERRGSASVFFSAAAPPPASTPPPPEPTPPPPASTPPPPASTPPPPASTPPPPASTPPPPASTPPPPVAKPRLSGLTVRPRTIAAGASRSTAAKALKSAKLAFSLSKAALVRVSLAKAEPGRVVGTKCAKPSRANRRGRSCTRFVTAGERTIRGKAGANKAALTAALARTRLSPGSYRLSATPTDTSGLEGKSRTAVFKVVGGPTR